MLCRGLACCGLWSWFGRMGPASRSSRTIVTRSRWVDALAPSQFVAALARRHGMALATAPPNTLRIGPSLAVDDHTIEHGIQILDKVLDALDRWDGSSTDVLQRSSTDQEEK